jgi:hypothetical protein
MTNHQTTAMASRSPSLQEGYGTDPGSVPSPGNCEILHQSIYLSIHTSGLCSTFLTGSRFLTYRLRLVDVLHDEDNHSSMAEWKNACVFSLTLSALTVISSSSSLDTQRRCAPLLQNLMYAFLPKPCSSSAHRTPAMSTCRNHLVTAAYHPLCLFR